jgi:acyl-CoA thioesterase
MSAFPRPDTTPEILSLWQKDPAPQTLGIRLLRARDGEAELALSVGAVHGNIHGLCHGGVIFTLADTAMGFAALSGGANGAAVTALTQGATINFLSPAREGEELLARAVLAGRHGRSALYDVTVSASEGRQVALMRAQARFLVPKG